MVSIQPQQQQSNVQNTYLDQVLMQQAKVDQELRPRKKAAAPARARALPVPQSAAAEADEDYDEEEEASPFSFGRRASASVAPGSPAVRAVEYRITGWGRWRTVVVPPNVYVVHTRRGREEPVTIGLGISFRFDPRTDAFLVIPAAMQTIVINANCICRERQGILVQAYVQWIVEDIRTAYRRLDFSDPEDPMRIVNVQLREQAEAAIKDKVATMSIDEVLSDKQPIIEELTLRLRAVAEGSGRDEGRAGGLGLKIVTVQIKEAVVSSTRLWENLQKPFRAERAMLARMAELQAEREITSRELEIRKAQESATLETEDELARLRAAKEREHYDRKQAEQARRHKLEQEAEQRRLAETNATAIARRQAELELALREMELAAQRVGAELEHLRRQTELERVRAEQERVRVEAETELAALRHQAAADREAHDVALFRARRAVENDLSELHVRTQLIGQLPEIARAMPQPRELRSVSIAADGAAAGPATSLAGLVASVLSLASPPAPGPAASGSAPPAG